MTSAMTPSNDPRTSRRHDRDMRVTGSTRAHETSRTRGSLPSAPRERRPLLAGLLAARMNQREEMLVVAETIEAGRFPTAGLSPGDVVDVVNVYAGSGAGTPGTGPSPGATPVPDAAPADGSRTGPGSSTVTRAQVLNAVPSSGKDGDWTSGATVSVLVPNEQAAAIASSWGAVATRLRTARDVLCDTGRLVPGSPSLPIAMSSDLLLLVSRPGVDAYAHLRDRLRWILEETAHRAERPDLGVLLIAPWKRRHEATDLHRLLQSSGVDVPVVGVLALDAGAADSLAGRRPRPLGRTLLVRSARAAAASLSRPAHPLPAAPQPQGALR